MRATGLFASFAAAVLAVACARVPALERRGSAPVPPLIVADERPVPAAVAEPRVIDSPPPAPPPPPPLPALPTERQTLVAEGGHGVEVYPPLDPSTTSAPLVVFLHATCMEPADICDYFSEGGRAGSFLVCPAGPSTCYGAPDWSGTAKLKAGTLSAAIAKVDDTFGAWLDRDRGDVLIGYSRGAFAARDILYREEHVGRFHGLVLLSASVTPDPEKLKAAGIRRAVLATGELDGSRPTMIRAVQKLEAAGIPTRFMSLGRIGHWLPRDIASILREAITWVEGPVS